MSQVKLLFVAAVGVAVLLMTWVGLTLAQAILAYHVFGINAAQRFANSQLPILISFALIMMAVMLERRKMKLAAQKSAA